MSDQRPSETRTPPRGWSLLWSASSLALTPQRLLLGFLAVAAIMGIGTVYDAVAGDLPDLPYGVFETLTGALVRALGETAAGLVTLDLPRASSGFVEGFIYAPTALARVAPWRCALLVLLLLPVWTLLGGAIARSAVMQTARAETTSVPLALAYAISRRSALVGAYVIPLLLVAIGCGLLWLFGFAFMRLPGLDIAGALFYGVALLIGFVTALVTLAFALAFPLLIPAVAADSADAADANQRAYSYLLERPFSLLVWGVALLAQGAVGVFLLAVIVTTALNWTADLTGASDIAGDARIFAPLPERAETEGTRAFAAATIGVWERLALALVAAHALSFFFSAASVLYLRVREAADRQAVEDVWPRVTAIESVRRGDLEAIADTHDA